MRFETQTNLYGDAPLLQKLTSHDTQFSVVQGKISAMITESELAELVSGGKTMYSAMNSIAIDVNGVHADMSRMNTVIGENSGQIETLNSQMTTYSATVDGISAEISATKIAHGGAETLQACFEASATEILQSVSRTYATQTDVEDLLVDTVYQFNKNTSASVPPAESDSGWSTTSPAREEGKYIWMRAERTFKNGEVTHTTPVCITGADGRDGIDGQDGRDGQDGAPGQQGPAGQPGAAGAPGVDGKNGRDGVDGKDGKDGKDGTSISDVVPQYYLSTSSTIISGGTWGTTIPSYVSGRYYWTRELVTRTDNTTFYTDPRLDAQLNNFESRLYSAEQKITDSAIVQTVTSSNAWGQVVTKGSVILEINNESSQYSIDADKINLNGYTTINGNFSINNQGYLTIQSSEPGSLSEIYINGDYILTRRKADGYKGIKIIGKRIWTYAYDLNELRVGVMAPTVATEVNSRAFMISACRDLYDPDESEISPAFEMGACGGLLFGVANTIYGKDYESTTFSNDIYMAINRNDNEAIAFYKPIITTTDYINGEDTRKIQIKPADSTYGATINFLGKQNDSSSYVFLSYLRQPTSLLNRFVFIGADLKTQTRETETGTWNTFFHVDSANNALYVYNSSTNRVRITGSYIRFEWWDSSTSKWQKRALFNDSYLIFYEISANQQDNSFTRFSKSTTYPIERYVNGTRTNHVNWVSG